MARELFLDGKAFQPDGRSAATLNLHTPEEIGIDAFQAEQAPDRRYRTAPLKGLWTHTKGGFFHDGRFATLGAVVAHYDSFLGLGLSDAQKRDLVEYLKSL